MTSLEDSNYSGRDARTPNLVKDGDSSLLTTKTPLLKYLHHLIFPWSIPLGARSKGWVYGYSLAGFCFRIPLGT